MTARTIPIAIPIAMQSTVSSSVVISPWMTRLEVKYWRMMPHSKRGLVAIDFTIATER